VARTTAPLVTDLRVEGDGVMCIAPACLPDLYAEAPALITVRVDARTAERGGEVVVRGRTAEGMFVQTLRLPPRERGQGPSGVVALHAREQVEDLEMALSAGADRVNADRAIENVGVWFQIATRLTSWVAVSKSITVDPARRIEVEQPHELPHAMCAEGLGLRQASAPAGMERYADVKVLGQGGMGIVYQAVDKVTGKRVAIKQLGSGEAFSMPMDAPAQPASNKALMRADESGEELAETGIDIGDIMGGVRGGKQQEIIFDSTEEHEAHGASFSLTGTGPPVPAEKLAELRERAERLKKTGAFARNEVDGAPRPSAALRPKRRTWALLLIVLLTLLALLALLWRLA
jgi:hypothetical protein